MQDRWSMSAVLEEKRFGGFQKSQFEALRSVYLVILSTDEGENEDTF